ncbi:response regulator transcription factor [Deferribacteres bacterium DY0037]
MRILLVEDDVDLAENIIEYFQIQNCNTDYAMSGEAALELLHDYQYDAIVLDINLPGINGFEVCKVIRMKMHMNVPIVMLTARSMLEDKLEGFESGTDDFLPKPFELAELKMRILALHRRASQGMAMKFCIEDLCVDPDNGTVTRSETPIILPPICFTILLKLIEKFPGIATKEELEYAVWKDEPPMTDSLKVHFYTLRQMVDKPFGKQLLYSIRGRGYAISSKEPEL